MKKKMLSSLHTVFEIIDFYVCFCYSISPIRLLTTRRTKAKVSLLLTLHTKKVSKNEHEFQNNQDAWETIGRPMGSGNMRVSELDIGYVVWDLQKSQVLAQAVQHPWAHERDSQAQWKSWLVVMRMHSEESNKWGCSNLNFFTRPLYS